MDEVGFIILRHIRDDTTSLYWRECVSCIRKHYDNKIIVIDDNSIVKTNFDDEEKEFSNIHIVSSEIQGSGEVYGYYYAYKYRPFERFVVLHDSMFLQGRVAEFDSSPETVKFLWHFGTYLGGYEDTKDTDMNPYFIKFCKENTRQSILNLYYNKHHWLGCFGVASFINLKFLDKLFEIFDFENVIKHVHCRQHREAMERVYALLCMLLDTNLFYNPSMFGDIQYYDRGYGGVQWSDYANGCRSRCMINKVWSGR
jgi:hypothetical protein